MSWIASADWVDDLVRDQQLTPSQEAAVREIVKGTPWLGQGNPKVTRHPMTPDQCQERRRKEAPLEEDAALAKGCPKPHMVPIPESTRALTEPGLAPGRTCIDQYEFPGQPCSYPVVWVRASEAAALCEAVGKRLCDAHEWEGACAGENLGADYFFDEGKSAKTTQEWDDARRRMQRKYNAKHPKVWAYGASEYKKGICAASSTKDPGCNGGDWTRCGSNTYPAGSFPHCRSSIGVYDLHGNAAEHMNLPLQPTQLASTGGRDLGMTEMKGSWFIWDKFQAHPDHCRWRAPNWHGSRVRDPASHHNYHLGFRCCLSL